MTFSRVCEKRANLLSWCGCQDCCYNVMRSWKEGIATHLFIMAWQKGMMAAVALLRVDWVGQVDDSPSWYKNMGGHQNYLIVTRASQGWRSLVNSLSFICRHVFLDSTSSPVSIHQQTSFLAAVGCTGLWGHLNPTEERVYWLCRPVQTCAATEDTWSSQDLLM